MGPFPHDAPRATITPENPAGTDGFEWVEFAHPEPQVLDRIFRQMGFVPVARHRSRDITLYRQGDINYLLNAEPGSHAAGFVEAHGPCAPAMAWRVVDAQVALRRALDLGAQEYTGPGKSLEVPAVIGIGGSLLYFVDTYGDKGSCYSAEFDWREGVDPRPEGFGFYYLDHLTHNVIRGNMDTWYRFYAETFNFREIKYFDIKGKQTGLTSRALTSPDGKIRIPINESADAHSQIEEYLREYKGEGIQHIAIATEDIYAATDAIAGAGMDFMPPPPDTYYEMSHKRVKNHQEPLERMQRHGILIDGEGVLGGGETRILLQIFSQTVIGPIFFEFIQRKGDDGFGNGNFQALFESIEEDQIRRGVLKDTAAE
ncbi:4-hydroxyphenylpyruvate dioxygenase [Pseudooceanicola sp. CBS1P-1]|uniref:4-hydroxyphenylpyruvate dioxygenase n=1 Tax=Pseudooceanicola albus TaxID=2692189 RepID=A0A6L7G5U7_9RHOB|nr:MULTISPECIES: 4-hydroxyphenylpyruvate dioxygenase [Pseudooceanicola]MBT9385283.1 4-hydroxyphenylpyruvate dioxygenase [Pseudooceanicola endophyticus]MXN18858.1 4-hydroxyphenylpyruvate dioxygenase [Pseudooceanicola albus]